MITVHDLIQWAHEWGAEVLTDGTEVGLSVDEICVIMLMAERFVLEAHPNPERRYLLIQEANALAEAHRCKRPAWSPKPACA